MSNRIDSNNDRVSTPDDYADHTSLAAPSAREADQTPPARAVIDEDGFETGVAGSSLDALLFPEDRYTEMAAGDATALSIEEARDAAHSPLEDNAAAEGFVALVADPSLDLDEIRPSNTSLGKDGRLDAGSLADRFELLDNADGFERELVEAMRRRPDADRYTSAELVEKARVLTGKVADDVEFAYMDAIRDRALPALREAQDRLGALDEPGRRRELLAALVSGTGDVDALEEELIAAGLGGAGARDLATRLAPLHLDDAGRAAFEAGEAGADTGWLPWQDGEYVEIDEAFRDGIAAQREALDDLLDRLGDDEADNSRLLNSPIFEHVRGAVNETAPWASRLAEAGSPVAQVLAKASARSEAADELEAEQIALLQEATKKIAPDTLVDATFGAIDAVIQDHEADLARTAHHLGMASKDYAAQADATADRVAAELGEALATEAMKAGGLSKDHPAVQKLAGKLEALGLPHQAVDALVDKAVAKARGAVETSAGALARRIRG